MEYMLVTGVKSEEPYCWMGDVFSVSGTIPIRLGMQVYASSLPGLVWVKIKLKLNLTFF
jgi:hypothetical protein